MVLKEYHRKRNFSQTPEPRGKVEISRQMGGKRPSKRLRFMIHKHAASRLHYDLRLELGGVLKSWAVPKGPSLNPKDKRLAVAVEDHPLAYANFEGVIPEGNYGAGTVMIWDEGTYEPIQPEKDSESQFQRQYKQGELKLRLQGKKLRGEFVLVKTRDNQAEASRTWLLIKHADQYAGATMANQDLSARSGRDMTEIAAGAPRRALNWPQPLVDVSQKVNHQASSSPGASLAELQLAAFPRQKLKPMLASLTEQLPTGRQWCYELKWDGYRALAAIKAGKVELYSRNGQDFNTKYPELVAALARLPGQLLLDGEIVAVDKAGLAKFQYLQAAETNPSQQLIFYIFDLLYFDKFSLLKLPLVERREILSQVIKTNRHLQISEQFTAGDKLLGLATKLGFEGIVAKDLTSVYQVGQRSSNWLKIKLQQQQEFVIGGYTHPLGNRQGFGSLLLGEYVGTKLVYRGRVGTGFTSSQITELMAKFTKVIRQTSPFASIPVAITKTVAEWLAPKFVAQVKFAELTQDKKVRQAVFLGLRTDKPAQAVRAAPLIEISHPDKLYWPEDKLTKADLIDYYQQVAPFMLPYLLDRPQNLNRHPEGIHGTSFYQKDFDQSHPDWLETKEIYSESTGQYISYVVCKNKETLFYLANLGCIEINPWNSRTGSLQQPDYLLFDLDPVEVDFAAVVQVAQTLHELLDSLKLPNYCKTSGKRGLHIFIPLGAKYQFEQARLLAQLLATHLQTKLPELISLERSPDKRRGKVYIDYLQNRFGQTTAAVYSARPVAGATVSTPLEWKEVNNKLDPQRFTIKTVPQRLAKVADLWQPLLGQSINIKTVLTRLK